MTKPLHLALFGITGPQATWLDNSIYNWDDPKKDRDMAKLAELAKFDLIFFADTLGIPEFFEGSYEYGARIGGVCMDPVVSMANMAAVTSKIGFMATVSTTENPYLVARKLATLDCVSNGRAGWNLVTSADQAAANNLGVKLPAHDERYDMADEHLDVCMKLWSSWDKDAIVEDRKNNIFADHAKIHRINHEGKYFRSRGPFNHPPMPQGHPAINVAGTSPRGMRFAAEHADMAISHKHTLEDMQAYSKGMRELITNAGRDPHACKLFFAIRPWIGRSRAEAEDRMLAHVEGANAADGIARLSYLLNYDLSKENWDKPLRSDISVNAFVSALKDYTEGEYKNMTLREIAKKLAAYEDIPIWGTAEDVADHLADLSAAADADGFHFRIATKDYPYLIQLTHELLPALRRRKLFRSEYSANTMKGHLTTPQVCDG